MEIERSELNSLLLRDRSPTNLADLKENNKHLIDIMESHIDVNKELHILAEALLGKLENQKVLSNYRDWISYFNKLLRAELEANTWFKVQRAVYKKVGKNMANYEESEKQYVSELEKVLKNIKMTLSQYEMLIFLKLKSNTEFHEDVRQNKTQAQDKLDSFPEEMQIFKYPLQQLFSSFDALES